MYKAKIRGGGRKHRAKYIQNQLRNLGYDVPQNAPPRGDDAVLLVRDLKPDLC